MSGNGVDDVDVVPAAAEPIAPGAASGSGESVSSAYTPALTAQYRDEVQGLLHSLFGDFL